MSLFSQKIEVTLIDDATGEPFARTTIAPTDLPETFAIETTLHLGDVDWAVVHADPTSRAEYSKSGVLTLRLRRIEKVDLSELLFSLPSICDRIEAVGDEPLVTDELVLAEDDWRQFELVSRRFSAEADAEIQAIRRIHEQAKAEIGWREIHVRRRPDPPIAAPLTLGDVDRAFNGLNFRGVTFRGASSPIVSGYSFRAADGLQCYGVTKDGQVTVLGIVQDGSQAAPVQSANALAEIAREFDLELVHWCRCCRVSWNDPLFRHLLLGTA
jgi:hypothetical protein